jgi:hypothetical protein
MQASYEKCFRDRARTRGHDRMPSSFYALSTQLPLFYNGGGLAHKAGYPAERGNRS